MDQLSKRAQGYLRIDQPANKFYVNANKSIYSASENPSGNINLATAINQISRNLIENKLSKSNIWEPKDFEKNLFSYPKYGGEDRLKKTIANFIEACIRPAVEVNYENLVIVPGVSAALDMVSYCVAEPGDSFLCPSPYYTRIFNNCFERSRINIISVSYLEQETFKINESLLNEVYDSEIKKGKVIKGIVMMNPMNPSGSVYSENEMMSILDFAKKRDLWMIMNENYALSVFNEAVRSKNYSMLHFYDKLPDPAKTVWMWGVSKDLCLCGIRFATIHCENKQLIKVLCGMEKLQPVSPIIQNIMNEFLSDTDWINDYAMKNVENLKTNYQIISDSLSEMGVPFIPASGGFFVLCDFSQFITSSEENLANQFRSNGVYITEGSVMASSKPGWFRIVFSRDEVELREALNRIATVLKRNKK